MDIIYTLYEDLYLPYLSNFETDVCDVRILMFTEYNSDPPCFSCMSASPECKASRNRSSVAKVHTCNNQLLNLIYIIT